MIRVFLALSALYLSLVGVSRVQAEASGLDALISEALANNPDLSVLRERLTVFDARISQAGALDDPTVRFEVSNLPLSSFDLSSTPMSGNQLTLSQKVPLPGKRNARERMASHAAQSMGSLFEDRKAIVINEVKQAYFTLVFVDRAIAVTKKNRALLQDLVRIVRSKYAVGKGLQQDVLKAQVSVSELDNQLISLKAKRKMAQAKLSLVLNRSQQMPVAVTSDTLTLSALTLTMETLQEMALAHRPLLKASEFSIEKSRAQEDLSRRNLWPDLTFSLGYRQRMFMAGDPVTGSDFISFGIGFSIPAFRSRKQRQQVVEARANIRMAEAQKAADRQHIFYEIQKLVIDIEEHRDKAKLFQTAMLPQAEQSLSSAITGYQVEKVDFLTLLDNQMTLFNFEIAYFRHVVEHEKRMAGLEAVVGRSVVSSQ